MTETRTLFNGRYLRLNQRGSWEYAERIQADPARFVQEAKQALDALVKRIQRENQEFYPSIEKLAAN